MTSVLSNHVLGDLLAPGAQRQVGRRMAFPSFEVGVRPTLHSRYVVMGGHACIPASLMDGGPICRVSSRTRRGSRRCIPV